MADGHAFGEAMEDWSWKREGLADIMRWMEPYKHPLPGGKILTLSQQPPDHSKGFWGSGVTDSDIVLAGYLERSALQGTPDVEGRTVLQLSAGPGLAGNVLAVYGAKTTITEQDDHKMVALTKNAAKLEAMEGLQQPEVAILNFTAVAADTDIKASLPWSIIVSSDEFLLYDDESSNLLIATLSRLSDFNTEIVLSYGRNRNGEVAFLKGCEDLFEVRAVQYEELHQKYRTLGEDVQVLRLQRVGGSAKAAAGPWHDSLAATVVPASPHLRGRQAGRPKSRHTAKGSRGYNMKYRQHRSFLQMPRRCRYIWWRAYCNMMADRKCISSTSRK